MEFYNEYQFNEKGIYETTTAWYKHGYTAPKSWVMPLVLCLLMTAGLLLLAFKPVNLVTICLSVMISLVTVGVATIFSVKLAVKRSVKAQVERLNMLYQNGTSTTSIQLSGTEIDYSAPGVHKKISYDDVLSVIQSQNFIILLLKGNITLPLKKNGFTTGTANQCLDFLRGMTKK